MVISRSTSHWLLGVIVVVYLILGSLYALQTPKWQVPDEPAHFNYVKYLVLENRLPVLQIGDYPHQYLEEIKAAHFPPHMSIAPIRYESWQPPLYYSLAGVLYRLTSSLTFDLQFLALRLFSVALGAWVLWVIYRLVQGVFPDQEFLALAAAAFAATIPMHVAITAGIGNDTLAELLLLLILWQAIGIIQKGLDIQRAVVIGMSLGLALLTKTTIYMAVPVVAIATCLQSERQAHHLGPRVLGKARHLLGILALSMLFAGPWFVRNALVYGDLDILAWRRHDMVVSGQLRTVDLLNQIGLASLVKRFALTTFRSFLAQFGWMGVLVDERIYTSLALLSVLLGLGFISFLLRAWRGPVSPASRRCPAQLLVWPGESNSAARQGRLLALLGISAFLNLLVYLGYNVRFVQHQGRYLFPALGPLALGTALSLRELLRPSTARLLTVALLLVAVSLVVYGVLGDHKVTWTMVALLTGAVMLAGAGWLPARWQWLAPAFLYAALLALDLICLYAYIIPALRIVAAS